MPSALKQLADKMTTDFPIAPAAYGLNGPSAAVTVEKSILASHTEILTSPHSLATNQDLAQLAAAVFPIHLLLVIASATNGMLRFDHAQNLPHAQAHKEKTAIEIARRDTCPWNPIRLGISSAVESRVSSRQNSRINLFQAPAWICSTSRRYRKQSPGLYLKQYTTVLKYLTLLFPYEVF